MKFADLRRRAETVRQRALAGKRRCRHSQGRANPAKSTDETRRGCVHDRRSQAGPAIWTVGRSPGAETAGRAAQTVAGWLAMGVTGVDDLQEAYRLCIRCARRAAGNFYFGFYGLDRARFRAICALYAFLRVSDDLADDLRAPASERLRQLLLWRDAWEEYAASDGPQVGHVPDVAQRLGPVASAAVRALRHTVHRFGIPHRYVSDVLEGLAWDLRFDASVPVGSQDGGGQVETSTAAGVRPLCLFADFAELERYCYHVAGAVGLCCIHIWGFADPAAEPAAIDCGTAFQLTNILRDIGEDWRRGRVYLPSDELAQFGLRGDSLASDPEALGRLLRFQVERAGACFDRAERLNEYLSGEGRAAFRGMFGVYRRLLDEVSRLGIGVLHRRARVPTWRKCWIAGRSLVEARTARIAGALTSVFAGRTGRPGPHPVPRGPISREWRQNGEQDNRWPRSRR
ncbi:MAG: squalene/phytoene synthase family protein [Planctomycetota bacterium]|nr:MAG: squalene/phytoene synthase family protein [Planctomycetota bacterium]